MAGERGGGMSPAAALAPDGAVLVYLPGIAGHPASSPVLDALGDAGWHVVVPEIPGLDGRSGFWAPDDYLGWLAVVWDALDATGALPCPVVGASLGGMLAADLAVFRPEAVTASVLLAPFESVWRMISPTAVTRSDSVSPGVVASVARKMLWLLCTRPPKLKFGPGKKLRSFSEKMPN